MKNRFAKTLFGQSTLAFIAPCVVALLVINVAHGQSYSETVRATNPVAYWRLGELQGKAAREVVAGRFGWYRGGVQRGLAGPFQNDTNAAIRFDGKSGFVRIPHDRALGLNSGAVAFWFNADDVQAIQGLLSKDATDFGDGGHLTVTLQRGEIHARLQSSSASHELLAKGVQPHRWVHVALAFGPAGLKLFVDGRLADQATYPGGLGESAAASGNREPLVLGASTMNSRPGSEHPLNSFFRGKLDEVAIFGNQLSDDQIAVLFASGHPSYTSLAGGYASNSPLAWWRLDEKPGASTAHEQVDELHGHFHVHGTFFDGDDYVDAGILDVCGKSMTILACLRATSYSVPDARLVAKAEGSALEDHYWMLSTASVNDKPVLRFRLHTDQGVREVVSNHELATGTWIFVAGVYDGKRIHVYVNGERVGSFPHGGHIRTNSHVRVWFGDSPAGAGSRPFDGDIRDVAVFDRALSRDQIRAIFLAKTSRHPPVPPPVTVKPPPPPEPPVPELLPPVVRTSPPKVIRTLPEVCGCPLCRGLIYEPIYEAPFYYFDLGPSFSRW